MKYFLLALSALFVAAWIWLGSTASLGGGAVPPLGQFFNPARGMWANVAAPGLDRHSVQSLDVEHPLAEGSVYFDDRGVPHVFADDLERVCFLQGYVHAADRLWQMDISTRATEGRLSEVLGARTQVRDEKQVRQGFRAASRRATETIRTDFPEDYALLQAYSEGVNAYAATLKEHTLPIEYKLLRHRPIRWSPYRSVLLLKGMSQSLSGYHRDAENRRTLDTLGAERFADLFPKYFPQASPIVPSEGQYPSATTAKRTIQSFRASLPSAPGTSQIGEGERPSRVPSGPPAESLTPLLSSITDAPAAAPPAYTLMPPHPDNGSNNWAVNARHSNTGYPMLASDPHLALTLPSIWYEIQLYYPGVNARGVSLPGAPGIAIGFNDHVAYGETNVGQDVTDYFRVEWTDSSRTEYLLDGRPTPARIVTDTVYVRGGDHLVIRTPYTVFGPVPYRTGPYADHARRYLAFQDYGAEHRPHSSLGTFLRLMRAENYEDYVEALRGYVDPAQNFLYADRHGEIAIRPNGFFPVRPAGDGSLPYDGTKAASNWLGYIPFEQRPVHRNPARGFVSSANQVSTARDYPYAYNGGFDEYRGRYINRRLTRERVLNQRTMKELQLSSHSLLAEELLPLLLARINRAALHDTSLGYFRLAANWDYEFTGESTAATFFHRWYNRVHELTFDDDLPPEGDFRQPELWRLTALLRNNPQHPIFDDARTEDFRETAATITQRAFDEIVEDLESATLPPWAEERNSRVRHLGAIPGFGSELIRSPGARFVPRVLSGGHGASWRMVVELGKHPRAWGSLPGGSSGQAASPHYDDALDEWAEGRYHELVRWREPEEAAAKSVGAWTF